MANSMEHWNGHQICAIDTETTGLDHKWHEMIQIAILPLDSNLEPRKDVIPFFIEVKPDYPERATPEALSVNRIDFAKIVSRGFDKEKAKDLLREWIPKLKLPYTKWGTPKKIMPLGQNYPFDMGFIKAWLGHEMYEEFFDYHYRDTCVAASFLNDKAAMHAERVPYSKVGLAWLAKQHGIVIDRAHDALQDCVATAKVYRAMLQGGLMA